MVRGLSTLAGAILLFGSAGAAADDRNGKSVVYAKDANAAAEMKLSEDQKGARICVKQKELGSRIRFQRVCMVQSEWIAYADSLDDMNREWNNAAKGEVIK